MRHDRQLLLALAANRHRRFGANGRPVFDLTSVEVESSTRVAMRLAQASKSQVQTKTGDCLASAA